MFDLTAAKISVNKTEKVTETLFGLIGKSINSRLVSNSATLHLELSLLYNLNSARIEAGGEGRKREQRNKPGTDDGFWIRHPGTG